MSILLETARLKLRACQIEDLPCLHALWTNERVRYFLFDDRVISLEEARSFIEDSLSNFEQRSYGLWLVFADGISSLVGFAGLLPSESAVPSLIYGIHPGLWGKGYATEAAGAVLRYALEELASSKVVADVDEPNAASVQVLEKIGMKQTRRAIVNRRSLIYFEKYHSL